MRKSAIVLFAVAGLLLISSFTFIAGGEMTYFVGGLVIAAVVGFIGFRQLKKPAPPAKSEASPASSASREYEEKYKHARSTKGGYAVLPDAPSGYELKYDYKDVKVAMPQNQDKITIGSVVSFEHEEMNDYDENAVLISVDNMDIGYLHKGKLQTMFHDFIARGDVVQGCIQAFDGKEYDDIRLLVGFYSKAKGGA